MKVDQLGAELRSRGISHRGLKAELVERLNKACEDKVLLIDEVTTSVGPSGFDESSKWRLLQPHEEALEPDNMDPFLITPGRARDQRKRDGIATSTSMKKFNYKEKFEREKFSAMALQLVDDKSKGRSSTSKKRKNQVLQNQENMRSYQ